MTAADDLLLRIVRQDWDPSSWQSATTDSDTDWTAIVQAALHHGVAGLMCRGIRGLPPGEVPQDIVNAADIFLENANKQGAVLFAQLLEILDVLAANEIPALPFKGPALGMRAHASATIRPSRDIDVLVHRRDMNRAVVALRCLDYRLADSFSPRITEACYESYGQDMLFAENKVPVEPHWAFTPKAFAVDLDMSGLWSRATKVDLAGRAVLALSAEDELLVACLHGSKEKWWRLLWAADVAAFIHRQTELDWAALMERAEASGIRRMVLLGFALARDLFSSVLPLSISTAIEQDPKCMSMVLQSKRYLFTPGADVGSLHHVSRYHLQARERVSDRVRYVWRTVTTPQFMHYRMVRLPEPLFHGYVPVKLVHDYLLLPLWKLGKGRWWRRTRNSIPDPAA